MKGNVQNATVKLKTEKSPEVNEVPMSQLAQVRR